MAVKTAAHHFLKIRRALHLQLKLNHHHLQFIHFTFSTHKMKSVIEVAAEAAEVHVGLLIHCNSAPHHCTSSS